MNHTALTYQKMNDSIALISTVDEGRNYGCIANSLHQVTASWPLKFSLSLSNDSATCAALKNSGVLAATLLDKNADFTIKHTFGYAPGTVVDKFAKFRHSKDAQGCPYLHDGMVARMSFRVVDMIPVDDYTLFICELLEGKAFTEGDCMTTRDCGDTVPLSAPAYHESDKAAGWKCVNCGLMLDDDLPAYFRCPVCHAPRDQFKFTAGDAELGPYELFAKCMFPEQLEEMLNKDAGNE